VQAAEAALGNWFMGNVTALLSILVGGLGFAAWVAAVTILGPVFLHRLLATGALFFAQAAASSARQAAVAGRLAVGAAQEHGLVAAVLGGPGPGPGERLAGGAAAIAVPLVGGAEAGTAGAQGGAASMAMAARRVDVSDGKGGASV
jgi:hypothetical protein